MIEREQAQRMLRAVLATEAFDARAAAAFEKRQLPFYLEQTDRAAVAVAAAAAMSPADWIYPGLHQLGVAVWRELDWTALAGRVLASGADPLRGRELPGLICSRRERIAPPTTNLGAHLAHALGCAEASKLRGTADVVLAFAGAASADASACIQALRRARDRELPLVILVDGRAPRELSASSIAFDAVEIHAGVATVARLAREGQGPALISIRPAPEDPLASLERAAGVSAQDVAAELADDIERAFEAAQAAGRPDATAAFEDVATHDSPGLPGQRRWLLGDA